MDKDRKYLLTVGAGVVIPLLQSLASGVILGLLALILAFVFHVSHPWAWCGVIGVGSLALIWLQLQRRWHAITNPLADPGRHDHPDPSSGLLVRLASEVDGNYSEVRATLPATLSQMQDLAAGLLAGEPCTERQFAGSGKPFSSAGFRELRDELVRRGMLAPASEKDPRAGYRLTYAGKAAMRAFVQDPPTPH